jgi:RHS repeat-associated protein
MPASLTQGGVTQSWLYGPEHDRYKLTTPGRTTWYMNPGVHQGGHYEQTHYASGTIEHRVTLYGGGKPIGEVLTFDSGAPSQTRYFHSDQQGSITAVTDQNGAVITRYRYDPWGKQTVVFGSNTGIDQTRQGHTGHEMLDGGLTHMNGRVYDPVLSRFVSADPYVDNPFDLQSLNRYSYVNNNPLGYTDPSGYFGFEISPSLGRGLFALGGIMFGAVLGPAGPIFAGGGWVTTLASGALAGGVGGFIGSGGNAQAARQGALAGGLFAGAGLIGNQLQGSYGTFANDGLGRAALHAVAGCISASAGGGSCGTGAMTAGFTKFAASNINVGNSDWAKLIKYSVIGGTASVIGGGKFANGAVTGAFQYLVNEKVSMMRRNTGYSSEGACSRATGEQCGTGYLSNGKLVYGTPKMLADWATLRHTTGSLNVGDLHTSNNEALKMAQGVVLAGSLLTPFAPVVGTVSFYGGIGLTLADPSADNLASTGVSILTRGLGSYGTGTWVEDFANGAEAYNTIWQMGDFAKGK